MMYEYKRQVRYWTHYRTLRRALEWTITAGAAVLASYLILARW